MKEPLIMREGCEECEYRGRMNSSEAYTVCRFMHDTGIPRGCSAEECAKNKIRFKQKAHANYNIPIRQNRAEREKFLGIRVSVQEVGK